MPGTAPTDITGLQSRFIPHDDSFEDTGASDPCEAGDEVLRLAPALGSYTLQGTASSTPTYEEDGNGWGHLDFALGDTLTNASFNHIGSQPFTVYIVHKTDAVSGNQILFEDGGGNRMTIRAAGGGTYRTSFGSNGDAGTPTANLEALVFVIDGSSSEIFRATVGATTGASLGTFNPSTNAWSAGMTLGSGGNGYAGLVYEVGVYNAAISDTDAGDLCTYLYDRYTNAPPSGAETVSVGYAASAGQGWSPTITPTAATVSVGYAASAAQGFSPTITPGSFPVAVGYASSAGQGFSPALVPGSYTLSAGFASSAGQGFSPSFVPGGYTVDVGYASSVGQGFSPTITPSGYTVSVGYASSAGQGFSPSVVPGGYTVPVGYAPSAAQGFSPTITPTAATVSVGFASTAGQGFSPTITPGSYTLSVGYTSSAGQGFSPTLTPGSYTVSVSYAASPGQGFSPTIVEGGSAATVNVGYAASAGQGFSPSVVPGGYTVSVGFASPAGQGFSPSFTPSSFTLAVGYAPSAAQGWSFTITATVPADVYGWSVVADRLTATTTVLPRLRGYTLVSSDGGETTTY